MRLLTFYSTLLILIMSITFSNAQEFLKKSPPAKQITFKEMQKRFDDWSKTTDLSKAKNWKYYKRWQSDMEKKTNGQGEPADPAIYINEAIKVAAQKQTASSSKFSAASWTPVGPFAVPTNMTGYMENGIGRINCIAFHPTLPATYFIGVAQGGLWKTTNDGVTWTPLTDNLPITRISDICIDPNSPNTMYISLCDFEYVDVALNIDWRKRNTHYGLGVYKTTDGGATWAPTGLSFQLTDGDVSLIRKIVVNPANSNQLAACGVSGMYTSANGGTSWTKTLDSLFWDLAQDPVNPSTLYAATGWLAASNIGSAAIYKSTNFGATWTMLNTGIPATGDVQRIKIAIAPSDNNYVYAFAVDEFDGTHGIYKSINAGATWNLVNNGSVNLLTYDEGTSSGGQGTYDLGFSVNPQNKNNIYVGGINVWASADGGVTFDPAAHWTLSYGPTVHADIHFIETQPSTGNIFVCNDGGLYRTDSIITDTWTDINNGNQWQTNWTNLSNGMAATSFYRVSSSRNATGRLAAGSQDNSTFYFDGTVWSTIFGGDGMDNYLDPTDDNMILGSSQYGNFSLSLDGGVTGNDPGVDVLGEGGEWTTPVTADYNNGNIYAGFTTVVNKSTDGGNSWFSLSPLPSNGIYDNEMSALAVANTNPNVIYAARRIRFEQGSPGGVYRTTNGGGLWTDITSTLPDSLYYTSVDVSQTDANTAYVAMAGLVAGVKVFRTTDGGATWQNISFNLPNAPVNCIKTAPGSNALLAGTDFGVFRFDASSNIWMDESLGLPNVIVSDIEFNTVLDKIYVATFGRGIWETTLSVLLGTQEEQTIDLGIELFPSPNNGTFTIQVEKNIANEPLQLEIIDITGRLVFTKVLEGQSAYKLNPALNSGMYFAKIKGSKLNGVKSFIVK